MKYPIDYDKYVLLKNRLDTVSKRMHKIIIKISTSTQTSNYYWASIIKDIRKEYESLRIIYAAWNSTYMPKAYSDSISSIVSHIKSMKFKPPVNVNAKDLIGSLKSKQTIDSLTASSYNTFALGLSNGEKTINQLITLTQQIKLSEKGVSDAIKEGLDKSKNVYSAQRQLQASLLDKSLDGKFITVIDKNGVKRMYDVSNYAELVARTETRKAQSVATVNTALEYNTDLVQISSHNTSTLICLPYEGKVFSITGGDPDFPTLDLFPPFHPNCLHTMTPTFKEVLQRRGLQKYIDFSNGTSEIHPTNPSHIPVSKRVLKKKASIIKKSATVKKSTVIKTPSIVIKQQTAKLKSLNSEISKAEKEIERLQAEIKKTNRATRKIEKGFTRNEG